MKATYIAILSRTDLRVASSKPLTTDTVPPTPHQTPTPHQATTISDQGREKKRKKKKKKKKKSSGEREEEMATQAPLKLKITLGKSSETHDS